MGWGETGRARERLSKYCVGNGIDVGYGGDPILPSAITIDIAEYYKMGDSPQNLVADRSWHLYWFCDSVLDYVYSSHMLEDFAETHLVLNEWFRVLKKGGFLVLVGPVQEIYESLSKRDGKLPNPNHKIQDFSLQYVKGVLEKHFEGKYKIIYEIELVDDYSFNIVLEKL